MLLGLVAPTSGTASVLGVPIGRSALYLPRVGALIEAPAFYPTLSGRRNLHVLATLGGFPHARVDAALERVGLASRAGDRIGGTRSV
jgi:ABC-2 type transport system ATP-binding protein